MGVMTLWLAYNLFFVLRDFCVVCVSMYVTNGAIIPMMHGLVKDGPLRAQDEGTTGSPAYCRGDRCQTPLHTPAFLSTYRK